MAVMLVLVAPVVLFALVVAGYFAGHDPDGSGEASAASCEFVDDVDEAALADLHAEALAALFPGREPPTARSSCSGLEESELYGLTVVLDEAQPSFDAMDAALEPLGWRRREGTEDVPRLAVLFDGQPLASADVVLRVDAEHEGLFVTVRAVER